MKTYERLLSYVKILTPSNEDSTTSPSSHCQFDLARLLVDELKILGSLMSPWTNIAMFTPIFLRQKAWTPANLLVLSHIWTQFPISAIIRSHLSSLKIMMAASFLLAQVAEFFPRKCSRIFLLLKGRTLITSDGTTILGADDKAGIAEIITALERILTEKIPHGPLAIAFTPDEESAWAAHFDVGKFGADYAYTLDGDTEGEIQYENFNACSAKVIFQGVNVHPGSSKNTMVNALLLPWNLIPCCQLQILPGTLRTMRDFSICVL